ncbi:protein MICRORCHIDIA 4-like [Corylus avellana]|uniref:protein MICRORCHIDIA 4-like n=1 Tax=Corylus avellana TaxID=13451 RepID=UPI00286BE365|nr:protein MICRORCHIDIA 4-like [Corylus avellana]
MKYEGKKVVTEGNNLSEPKDRTAQVFTNNSSSSRTNSSSGSSDIDDSNDSKVEFARNFISSVRPVKGEEALPVTEAWPLSVRVPVEAALVNYKKPKGLVVHNCKQFWKAGDYEITNRGDVASTSAGIEHVRVHPKFLHSNATSHKWALGAFAELLDNSLDEVCNGATYVYVDVLENRKDGTKMLQVEDDGGGMTPDKMRQCMSLGYSVKSNMANTIGQYGNGFKTSTMRLGADVLVFSRCQGNDGQGLTQSIGMLSYTFLRGTGKEDVVVPMIDFEKKGQEWKKMTRSSLHDWNRNLATILQWSPYANEEELFKQFNSLNDHGTRIIIYNLWEDDEGNLELDFDTDKHDIQLRGVNRDEKSIQMAQQYPNSRHFLTYQHSLRSYASILYLKLPANFRIMLRGKDVQHHNIVNDMMLTKEIAYKPLHLQKDPNMAALGTIGFVKDAKSHIDIQGFSIYHKNRLIKPFWRLWNPAGSDGRGVIGVLEANFVEPAHDKQGFERTTVLSRLEQRLIKIQRNYWSANCQEIGYAARRRQADSPDKESLVSCKEKSTTASPAQEEKCNGSASPSRGSKSKSTVKSNKRPRPVDSASEDESFHEASPSSRESKQDPTSNSKVAPTIAERKVSRPDDHSNSLTKPKEDKGKSSKRLKELGSLHQMNEVLNDLQHERERRKSLELQVQEKQSKIDELDQEQITLIDMIAEERGRRDALEKSLRNKLKEASATISELLEEVKQLEGKKG